MRFTELCKSVEIAAEPQKLSWWTLAGVSTASAIGGDRLAGQLATEKTTAPIPWAATGSLCRECHGYAIPERERLWRTLRGVFLSSRCQ